uniref:MYND-type domain-containing protein n=1 Tax=Mycena chlorophos TaxID=658473 RepID=A0ABQ0M100_MYCCL|nr:predicted protein [Mycena chlorophos]
MHPLFSIHALDRLPISLRACAKRAANGSEIHKDTILISLKNRTIPSSQIRHLLPIFIADLRISRISTLREIDSWEEGRNSELLDGYIGDFITATEFLTDLCMRDISLPPAAWRELWDLLLPWGTFLCEFEQNIGSSVALPRFIGHPKQWQLCLFSSLLLLLEMTIRFKNFDDEKKNLRRHLLTSQDVFSCFAHIWSRLLDAWRLELTRDVALMARSIAFIIETSSVEFEGYTQFDKLVTGAGGAQELAATCAAHLELVLRDAQSPLLAKSWKKIMFAIPLITGSAKNAKSPYFYQFMCTMDQTGLVTRVTASFWALQHSQTPWGDPLIRDVPAACFGSLFQLLALLPYRAASQLVTALQQGLLDLLFVYDATDSSARNDTSVGILEKFIGKFLPGYAIFGSVVSQFRKSVAKMSQSRFHNQHVQDMWEELLDLYSSRGKTLDVVQTFLREFPRACAYIGCHNIYQKHQMQFCSGCQTALYCSRTCQKLDWRSGHRETCVHWRNMYTGMRQLFKHKMDLIFFEHLVYQAYLTCQLENTLVALKNSSDPQFCFPPMQIRVNKDSGTAQREQTLGLLSPEMCSALERYHTSGRSHAIIWAVECTDASDGQLQAKDVCGVLIIRFISGDLLSKLSDLVKNWSMTRAQQPDMDEEYLTIQIRKLVEDHGRCYF